MNPSRQEYINRIYFIQDYIDAHISEELSLDVLAEVSGFSKYHFHRIFSSMMEETLFSYVRRQRLEKAANILTGMPDKTITEIAYELGFSDSAVFARAFRNNFGMSAREFRKQFSKNYKVLSKQRKEISGARLYTGQHIQSTRRQNLMKPEKNVETVELKEMTVIYLRHVGAYEEMSRENTFSQMIQKLIAWASARGCLSPESFKLMSVYHDNHEVTAADKLRTSVCLAVPEDTKVEGEIGKMRISGGRYAVGHFVLHTGEQHSQAWDYFYGEWLPNSGYQPRDGYNFEMYMNDPNTDPENRHMIDIYMPIKSL